MLRIFGYNNGSVITCKKQRTSKRYPNCSVKVDFKSYKSVDNFKAELSETARNQIDNILSGLYITEDPGSNNIDNKLNDTGYTVYNIVKPENPTITIGDCNGNKLICFNMQIKDSTCDIVIDNNSAAIFLYFNKINLLGINKKTGRIHPWNHISKDSSYYKTFESYLDETIGIHELLGYDSVESLISDIGTFNNIDNELKSIIEEAKEAVMSLSGCSKELTYDEALDIIKNTTSKLEESYKNRLKAKKEKELDQKEDIISSNEAIIMTEKALENRIEESISDIGEIPDEIYNKLIQKMDIGNILTIPYGALRKFRFETAYVFETNTDKSKNYHRIILIRAASNSTHTLMYLAAVTYPDIKKMDIMTMFNSKSNKNIYSGADDIVRNYNKWRHKFF